MGRDEVTLTIKINTRTRQMTNLHLSSDLDPFIVAIIANQVGLRALKQHADEMANQAKIALGKSKIEIIRPGAAESISALNGTKDAKALQLK